MRERRKDPRVATLRPITVDIDDGGGCAGLAEDMSAHGVRIRMARSLPVGSRVRLRVLKGDDDIDVAGVVVRRCGTVRHSLFEHGFGVRLDDRIAM